MGRAETNLFSATLRGANLRGADFSLAAVGMTDWGGLDLSEVKHLDRATMDRNSGRVQRRGKNLVAGVPRVALG
jgi:uncharacterized protein YjbI with pentapeptide repeats